MHVKFAAGSRVPAELRWRGIALTNFDGRRWTTDRDQEAMIPSTSGVLPSLSHLSRPARSAAERVVYDVSLEPFGSRVFFVIPQALVINGRYRMLAVDVNNDTIFNADTSRGITDYGVVSEIPPPMSMATVGGSGPLVDPRYLQLPNYVDARIPALAQQITENEPTSFRKASAIERYLSTTYGYTLQLPLVPPKDPVANFLFQRKMGHCEYFASSMAVMLRTLGIPSRVVNGFRGGLYNDITGTYIVRARDAHSWVEAYFPEYGWYTFDPTPGGAQPAAGAMNRAFLYLDAMREFWHEWVVNYDTGHQASLALSAARRGRSEFEHLRDWFVSIYEGSVRRAAAVGESIENHIAAWISWTSAALILLFAFVAIPKLRRAMRHLQIARKPGLEPHSAATIWYGRALRLLSKRGIKKSGTQTPQEFLRAVPTPAIRHQVERFTTHYERARFGDSAPDAEKLPELYRELEEEVKK
jgi:transglutaminase-like putative cysteine protease